MFFFDLSGLKDTNQYESIVVLSLVYANIYSQKLIGKHSSFICMILKNPFKDIMMREVFFLFFN